MRPVEYSTTVRPDWIDYNGHMQDAFYGLIFSYGVDAFQDAVGFDRAYREATGCTIYLLEDHKYFLREVKVGAEVLVRTYLIGLWEKRFHLWSEMLDIRSTVILADPAFFDQTGQRMDHRGLQCLCGRQWG